MPRLVDPYVSPILYIRQPGEDAETRVPFPDDDPFFSEISHFIDAIENPEADPKILSSYDGETRLSVLSWWLSLTGPIFTDAARTYELTWAIRQSSEQSRDLLRSRKK